VWNVREGGTVRQRCHGRRRRQGTMSMTCPRFCTAREPRLISAAGSKPAAQRQKKRGTKNLGPPSAHNVAVPRRSVRTTTTAAAAAAAAAAAGYAYLDALSRGALRTRPLHPSRGARLSRPLLVEEVPELKVYVLQLLLEVYPGQRARRGSPPGRAFCGASRPAGGRLERQWQWQWQRQRQR